MIKPLRWANLKRVGVGVGVRVKAGVDSGVLLPNLEMRNLAYKGFLFINN